MKRNSKSLLLKKNKCIVLVCIISFGSNFRNEYRLGLENAQFDQGESQMTVSDAFLNSDLLSSDLELPEEKNPQAHMENSGHPIVQFLQEEKYNWQKGLITKLINFFRTNCQNPNFNQTQWNKVKQQLENQLHQMESSCLDFLKLPTLTFVEAIDMGQDFAQ
jgi:hypothetical protein